jgi:hypothetical protein
MLHETGVMSQRHGGPHERRDHRSEGRDRSDEGRGLHDEFPRVSGIAVVAGIGMLWGALCYSVLWEGTPFAVDRAFVEGVLGTLVLLPARLVLWAIRWVELVTDRTFDLADNHLWIGFLASAIGATIAVIAFLAARAIVRRLRGNAQGSL